MEVRITKAVMRVIATHAALGDIGDIKLSGISNQCCLIAALIRDAAEREEGRS